MNRRRLSTTSRCSVAIIAAVIALSGCDRKGGGNPWVVGHLAVESGPGREHGESIRRGITLAVEQINEDTGRLIAGRKVVVLHADTKDELDLISAQATRLAGWNGVSAIIGGDNTSQAQAASAAIGSYDVAMVTTGGIPPGEPRARIFAMALGNQERARAIAQHLAALKPARVVLVHDTSEPKFFERFEQEAAKQSLALELFNITNSADLGPLKSAPAIVLALSPEKSLTLRVNLQKSGLEPGMPMIFGGDESDLRMLQNNPAGMGLLAVTSYVADEAMPRFKEFAEAFHKRFNVAPDADAARSYDATRVLLAGAAAVKTFELPKLRTQLREMKDFSALNGPLSFTAEQTINTTAFIVRLSPEGRKVVATIENQTPGK